MLDIYYSALISLLFISFGIGLFHSTKRARYFAYAGVFAYVVGLFGGAYYG
jgi:ATP/ADP translocase